MTTTTLGDYDIVQVILDALEGYASWPASVSVAEIKEANWMEDEFTYPAIRYEVNDLPVIPLNGNCRGMWFDLSFSVFVYTEGRSTKDCRILMRHVGRLFQNNVLSNADLETLSLMVVYMPPVPQDVNSYRGEVLVTAQMREKL